MSDTPLALLNPPPTAPPPPMSRRRSGRRWWIIGTSVLLVLAVGVSYLVSPLNQAATATIRPAPRPSARSLVAPPDTIEDTLSRQAGSLLAGYEEGWLAPVDPTDARLLTQYRSLYTRLRTLGVTTLRPEFALGTDHCCTATVYYGVCMQTDTCPVPANFSTAADFFGYDDTESLVASITWRPTAQGRNILTAFTIRPTDKDQATQPLLDGTALRTRAGRRVLVAAPAALAGQLAQAVRAADTAAKVADTYAHWTRPTRYIVYLANPAQWRTWYGGEGGDSTAIAYAEDDSRSTDVVVVNEAILGEIDQSLEQILQHEFGHVVSLLGTIYHNDDVMTEGFAEYVEENGRPISQYYRINDTRDWLATHRWSGNPDDLDQHIYSSDVLTESSAYGVGYLTWRCIASHFGFAKMMSFAGTAIHYAESHDAAARESLGVPWTSVTKICGPYVRNAVG